MDPIKYPDNGEPLEDASILRNAIQFSTQQRAFVATTSFDSPRASERGGAGFHAVEAFMSEPATEDTLVDVHQRMGARRANQEPLAASR
jgi:hypothetical protein